MGVGLRYNKPNERTGLCYPSAFPARTPIRTDTSTARAFPMQATPNPQEPKLPFLHPNGSFQGPIDRRPDRSYLETAFTGLLATYSRQLPSSTTPDINRRRCR
ncbi:hypothetical protein B0T26DRAFT_450415 [Lasiosphaeria miniovina]|uniref:Uncharacterized protein n=1 Tax=Lasiosphaeria miniovina TaxID=1954250 RepID=A0AA40DNI5_9PEZI|nr:uncharacterized protein B0T26DRAFT_450415 [Lasiosphaeria miniovina]KAK0706368.1 hypothetical protein B0T26DRAFT_450415 [Lasiosphaeria miniovina]